MSTPLDTYLTANGMTGRDFARAVGISEQTLSKLRRGHRAPTLEQALRIDAATGGAVSTLCWADAFIGREAAE